MTQEKSKRNRVGEEHESERVPHYTYLMGLQHSENYKVFTASMEKQQTVELVR